MDIALQLSKTTAGSVAVGGNVLFNVVDYNQGNISYNSGTGEVIINDAGRFVVDWWISAQSSAGTNGSVFSVVTDAGADLVGCSPMKTGETTGFAIFDVVTPPVVMTLQNSGLDDAFYNLMVPLTAGLKMVQDDLASELSQGSITPFATGGTPAAMTTVAGGLVGLPSFIAFGNSATGILPLASPLDIEGQDNMAFSVPRDGTITALTGFFSVTTGLDLTDSTVTVNIQLWQSATPDNTFTPIAGTSLDLTPDLAGIVAVGTNISATLSGLSIAVTEGTRLLMVYSATATGTSLVNNVIGTASAGVNII